MAKIAVVLTQGFADWEYALIGGTGGPFYGLDILYFSPTPGELRSQGGLTALVSLDMGELSAWRPDVVVIVGGTIWETEQAPDIGHLLKVQYKNGAVIGGICGGTLALARAGLINDVQHTSNDANFLIQNASEYSGSEQYKASASAVSTDRVITAPGTAPASFTAAIFESAGVDGETVLKFRAMMAAEHN